MKIIFSLVYIIFSINFAIGQVVYSVPAHPSVEDSIVIYFDATQGDQGLMGYAGDDVYAHTGVLTNYSTDSKDWKHVIAEWNEDITKARLTRIDTDLYKLVIGYPREFYAMDDSSEYIEELAFVFRNSGGSVTGRASDGGDIFLALTKGFHVSIIKPDIDNRFGNPKRFPVFADPGDSIHIDFTWTMVETEITALELFRNDEIIAETGSDTLTYIFTPGITDTGYTHFKALITDTSGLKDSSEFEILVNSPNVEADLPQNTEAGINYIDDHSVTLALYAPFKKNVYVIGDFNDWMVEPDYRLNKYVAGPDSVYWWITIDNLTPGTEYAFQYLVDGHIRIADPYTQKVLDPWNDQYIDPETYPDLKPYPEGKTGEICSILETGQTSFNWQIEDFSRPVKSKLVIYELLIRDFVENHNYLTLIDTLNYLETLGVNAVELMPVNEFEGNLSWGYNPSFYFAPDKYYGPSNTLKKFIDACHARGIAVILDMVLNHSYGQSPFVRLYNEGDYGKPTSQNPWYNVNSPNPVFSWGMDFNHESSDTKTLVDRINRYWLTEYKADGFRFDFTKGFTNKSGDGSDYDASRIAILERMADALWQADSSAYVILEHFASNDEEKVLANYGMMLWGNSYYNYNEASMGYNTEGKSDFSWGFYKTRGWEEPNLVTYMESHDEERLMYKNLEYGNSSGSYNIQNLATALQRIKMNGAFFFTLPGPKMIWQFGELGYDYSIDYNGRVGNKPIRWDYLDDINRNKLYRTFAALINLRKAYALFTNPSTTISLDLAGKIKKIVMSGGGMNVAIIGNFDVNNGNGQLNFYHGGLWFDFFS
ncbi:MAG: alpha-amylase family glycosyl hydrolase, partial [Calditrichaceae bacterium]